MRIKSWLCAVNKKANIVIIGANKLLLNNDATFTLTLY